jgi:hypothetical protein
VKLRQLGGPALLARAALLVEDLGQLLDRLSLPSCNLGWMQFVLGRQLRNRLVALDRLKRDFALNSAENRLRVLMVFTLFIAESTLTACLRKQDHLSPRLPALPASGTTTTTTCSPTALLSADLQRQRRACWDAVDVDARLRAP